MSRQASLKILVITWVFALSPAAWALKNVRKVSDEVYRGSHPINQKDYDQLKSMGVKSLLNLRYYISGDEAKERADTEANGFTYLHIGMETVSPLSNQTLDEVLSAMSNPQNQPTYIHCLGGLDRTALAAALYVRHVMCKSKIEALQQFKGMNFWMVGLKNYLDSYPGPSNSCAP